jgi:branched-chain amino acid transport system permease protein
LAADSDQAECLRDDLELLLGESRVSFFPSMIIAGVVGIIVAILIGMPLLRLKGHYFALASLGAAEAVRQIMDNLTDLCGGAWA